ncbi:MAG: tetrahydrofolate dehydrogenase/cyclohydrolase catalytic domain-containing protein, partial [Gallicola sp.]|nr:tetrahydrofolate dehydrogenase/cyclohydrolase catalytic domain-containing protein [Gallicola sp.]
SEICNINMKLLDGKIASASVKEELRKEVEEIIASGKRAPHLAVILVGNNGASETYVASKQKSCAEIDITSTLIRLDTDVTEETLLQEIEKVNTNDAIDGLLVQLPLPKHINEQKIIEAINPAKDVDGFHPVSAGNLMLGMPTFIPATPFGIVLMLQHYGIKTSGKHAVIVGRSNIVGRPMSILLSNNTDYGNCTVTVCHSRTTNLKEMCLQADILVAALGKPEFVTADMVKEGAIVIDVGITRMDDEKAKRGYRIKGDVNFKEVAPKTSYIT